MKKLLVLLFLATGVMSVHAQKIGLKAGLNFANAVYEESQTSLSTDALVGPQFGIVADFPIDSEWAFNTGILYSQKGLKMDFIGVEVKVPVQYLEVPLNLAYKHELESLKLFVQAGPYLALGLSAKAKSGGEEEKIEFGSDDDQIKGYDAGLNIGAGVEIEKLQLGVNYGLGLLDLENDNDAKMKNSVFSITLAYFFGN